LPLEIYISTSMNISTNTYESYSLPLWCRGPFQKLCVARRQGL